MPNKDNEDIPEVLNQRWYLLGQPWCHSSQADTTILAGSNDPHVATVVADTEMMLDGTSEEFTMQRARAVARHIVELHNENL